MGVIRSSISARTAAALGLIALPLLFGHIELPIPQPLVSGEAAEADTLAWSMPVLGAARLHQLPWTSHAARRQWPPECRGHSPGGSRLCDLCGASYIGEDACRGGRACPRHFGFRRRRNLEWHDGYWVPRQLAVRWAAEDNGAADPGLVIPPLPHGHGAPFNTFGVRAWTPPGAADFAAVFKAPPTAEQLAGYRHRTHAMCNFLPPGGPPPKPPPPGLLGPPNAQQVWAAAEVAANAWTAKPRPKLPPPFRPASNSQSAAIAYNPAGALAALASIPVSAAAGADLAASEQTADVASSDSDDAVDFGGMWSLVEATVAPTTLENADTEMQTEVCEQRRQHLHERDLLAAATGHGKKEGGAAS